MNTNIRLPSSNPRIEFAPLAINLYINPKSFDQAGLKGTNAILPLAEYLTSVQIGEILEIALSNSQVTAASATPDVLDSII